MVHDKHAPWQAAHPFPDAPLMASKWGACSKPFEGAAMCRSIKTLFNFDPPATEAEIRAASLQFVRKLSGFNSPSKANQAAFDKAVEDVAASARVLVGSLVTSADPRTREEEAVKARERSAARFGVAG
jgi:hypothetical protein